MKKFIFGLIIFSGFIANAQNPLFIPPSISGTTFNLNIQSGTQNFYPSNPTPTYGINGTFLSPTIIVYKGDVVTLNVNNGLPVATTMHWHGLHVSPMNDGGPHQSISPGTSWSPSFEILNSAGTFWYHPHGAGKTELHVGKGLAGMFIIHDPIESALALPQTYGVDDIPLITQTKAFDILNQIALATQMDTAVFMNGTLDATLNVPAQVIRFRVLNGSSLRAFNYGFTNGMAFYQIATDGGLIDAPLPMTRMLLLPGERKEILVDFGALQGQTFDLNAFNSELTDGIYGASIVGVDPDTINGYSGNPLNGNDFPLLSLTVVPANASPITTIPATLTPYVPYNTADATVNRVITFDTLRMLPMDVPNLAAGPFGINGKSFDMDSINIHIPLNSEEIWTLKNNTHIAHPFHIHDIQFNIIERSGAAPLATELGWKDVVVVMPHDSVKFLTKFTDFTDEMVPYMYHCHLLHHEDDGMMGAFLVHDPNIGISETKGVEAIKIFPNPTNDAWNIDFIENTEIKSISLVTIDGIEVYSKSISSEDKIEIPAKNISAGIYFLKVQSNLSNSTYKLEKVD